MVVERTFTCNDGKHPCGPWHNWSLRWEKILAYAITTKNYSRSYSFRTLGCHKNETFPFLEAAGFEQMRHERGCDLIRNPAFTDKLLEPSDFPYLSRLIRISPPVFSTARLMEGAGSFSTL